jgi:hypothetical protein
VYKRVVVREWAHIAVGALLGLGLVLSSPAVAQNSPFQALAEHLVAPRSGPYRGPVVALEVEHARPAAGDVTWCALERPLCVHGTAADAARAPQVLVALERAYDWLLLAGWPLPYPDGGAGGTLEHDLYLAHAVSDGAAAYPEQLAAATPLDAATAFGLLERSLPSEALPRCALVALSQAGLLARDPAEPAPWRRASAQVASWLAAGEWGCQPDPHGMQQAAALGLLDDAPAATSAAAVLLAWLDRRHQGGSGELVRELWELAAQRSAGPSALHAQPSGWEALGRVLESTRETLEDDLEEVALQRALAPAALGLPAGERAPLLATVSLAKLPVAVSSREALAGYGSAFVRVQTVGTRPGSQLRIWLRGEPGVRWSLLAARLDARERNLGQLSAPPRTLPESFLPIELTPDTHAVLIAVTALPLQTVPERVALAEHHFRITVALAQ